MRKRLNWVLTLAAAGGAMGVAGAVSGPALAANTTAAIAYQSLTPISGAPSGVRHIFVMNTAGQGIPVTRGATNDVDPAWSPDGTKIAFAREDTVGDYNIYVMNADGTGVAPLTTAPKSDRYPAWSPDGTKIAFRGYPASGTGTQIFTMTPTGAGRAAIPGTAGGDQPSWSPDGTRIAFTLTYVVPGQPPPPPGTPPTTDDDVAVINVDGTGLVNLTTSTTTSDRYPAWSPTNPDLLLFRRLDPSGNGRELYTVTVAGHAVTNLSGKLGPGRAGSWSPDGQSLVFASGRSADHVQQIWLSSFDGTTTPPRQLTNTTAANDEPRWANVPVAAAPVPPPPPPAAGGPTVGGGVVLGRQLLSLTLVVPARQKLGLRKNVLVFARCNQRCTVTLNGVWKVRVGKTFKVYRLVRLRHVVLTRRQALRLRIPPKALVALRGFLRRYPQAKFVVTGSARNAAGEFTPAASRKLRIRK